MLLWSAIEVAARDTFIVFLNQRPESLHRLLRDPATKRRFDVTRIPIETLAGYGFDLSQKMGTFLSSSQDRSDLVSIKTALLALFGSAELREALGAEDLRELNQRRHIIVHRCGVVDEGFAQKSKSSQRVGERLATTPAELLRYINAASKACLAIVESAQRASLVVPE